MLCPVCKKSMVVLELQQVEIDHCMSCGGIWLDPGELELLNGASLPRSACVSDKGKCARTEKIRRCPVCSRGMKKMWYHADSDVCVDQCARGHGTWLDKGELDSLLRISHTVQADTVVRLLQDMFRYEASQKKEETV